ncbi:unnamed protein product, partial [Menidia menidia]
MTKNEVRPHVSSVSFESKIHFSARQDLIFTRSKYLKLPGTEGQRDQWSTKPPDSSVKLPSFRTLLPGFLPNIEHSGPWKKTAPKFTTRHRPPNALGLELKFVKTGKYPHGPYKDPQPHNFRPASLHKQLPDMITVYERDPGNLRFKLKHLDTLRTTRSGIGVSSRDTKTKMDTYKAAEPKWDLKLLLPPLSWPPLSASHTVSRPRSRFH